MNEAITLSKTTSTKPAVPNSTPATVDVPTTAPTKPLEPLHDVAHQVRLVRDALQSEKRRVGFFLGAGCPLGIYDADGKASVKHIPDVAGLTAAVCAVLKKLVENETKNDGDADLIKCWEKLCNACKGDHLPTPTVEHILTQLRTICALKGNNLVDGMTADGLKALDSKICETIAGIVGKPLPKYITAYHRFAAWLGHLDRVVPAEIFTPNYDLLLEEALEQYRIPFFDGFVGSREPFFDLSAMEHDVVPSRWTRLWKLHGSINWVSRGSESVFRRFPAAPGEQLLIYPSHLKYDQSRRMPYLAMIDRLRAFFREANPVLILCGYSFSDDHLNEVLLDGLRGNRSAHCFALMYSGLDKCDSATSHAKRHPNLTVLAWDGAVVGTRPGGYKAVDQTHVSQGSGFDAAKSSGKADADGTGLGKCRLGDFHFFTLFLESQFGAKASDEQIAQNT